MGIPRLNYNLTEQRYKPYEYLYVNVKATDFCPITDGIACP